MTTTRRAFMRSAVGLAAGGSALALSGEAAGTEEDMEDTKASFTLFPVGRVEKAGETVQLRIFDRYADALLGLDGWSHANVLYWFDKNDVPAKRKILRVHPRGDPSNPLTGVFACRAPVRPNLIALSVCRILAVENNVVRVDKIDAFDGSPVLDLKPFIPPDAPQAGRRFPAWTGAGR